MKNHQPPPMNKNKCCACGKSMGNSLHKVNGEYCHKHCEIVLCGEPTQTPSDEAAFSIALTKASAMNPTQEKEPITQSSWEEEFDNKFELSGSDEYSCGVIIERRRSVRGSKDWETLEPIKTFIKNLLHSKQKEMMEGIEKETDSEHLFVYLNGRKYITTEKVKEIINQVIER